MAISDTDVKQGYQGNGVTTAFAIPFDIIEDDSDEVKVYVRDETAPTAPVITLAVEGALQDYTLTGAVPPGTPFATHVTFNSAPSAAEKIFVTRNLTLTQPLDQAAAVTPDPEAQETAFDRAIALVQQLNEQLIRSPKISITEPTIDMEIPQPVGATLIGFNDDADGLELYTVEDLLIAGAESLAEHLADTAGAHAASAIAVTPAGNLEATEVQAALVELQGDIDSISPLTSVLRWTKYTVGHAALQAAALTNDIELFSLLAKEMIHAVVVKHATAFAGASVSAYEVSVGIAGELDKYSGAFDVLQATGNTVKQITNVVDYENHAAATSIRVAATAIGANLDQSSAGSVEIWVLKSLLT